MEGKSFKIIGLYLLKRINIVQIRRFVTGNAPARTSAVRVPAPDEPAVRRGRKAMALAMR
jgi:hypothetical protein